jgi:hypothetical protein
MDPKRDEYDASTLRAMRSASTCRWGAPTLFLDLPLWLDSERCPWACVRDPTPRVLATTESCATCPHWEPRPEAAPAQELRKRASPMWLDWLGALPPPHEAGHWVAPKIRGPRSAP